MVAIPFEKYQGTGNDFILIEHLDKRFEKILNPVVIAKMCDRHFGIGADGLILLEISDNADFKMVYYNADGNHSTMCGNGGRCIVAFAASKSLFRNRTVFEAIDGLHEGIVHDSGYISLHMQDVSSFYAIDESTYTTDTGSPHYVQFCSRLPQDIPLEGSKIRYTDAFKQHGINVNFVREDGDSLFVATYERGVEDETLSCGTGVTAAALSYAFKMQLYGANKQAIITKGGTLEVDYNRKGEQHFTDIWLTGPAQRVFSGEYII